MERDKKDCTMNVQDEIARLRTLLTKATTGECGEWEWEADGTWLLIKGAQRGRTQGARYYAEDEANMASLVALHNAGSALLDVAEAAEKLRLAAMALLIEVGSGGYPPALRLAAAADNVHHALRRIKSK
jgi:hypothetical protein